MPGALKGAFETLSLDPPMLMSRGAVVEPASRAGRVAPGIPGRLALGRGPVVPWKARSRHRRCPERRVRDVERPDRAFHGTVGVL